MRKRIDDDFELYLYFEITTMGGDNIQHVRDITENAEGETVDTLKTNPAAM